MVHRFGDVEVDEAAGEIRVGGQPRRVEPQVMAVLTYLIRERHRVVPKDELLDEVWGTRHVGASSVTSRIRLVRQAVDDSGRDQRVIRTVHGRGFRFVAELDRDDAPDRQDPSAARRGDVPATDRRTERDEARGRRGFDDSWPIVARDGELASIVEAARDPSVGGVLLTGPPGVGKSRLARAVIETLDSIGSPVARINGHAEASTVPLASFAHLLPDDVVNVVGLQGDLARSVLFQRARAAILALARDRRLALMVDDIDRIDRLSLALIGSLIGDGSVYAVMTQRVVGEEALAMDDLIRSGRVRHRPLDPLPTDQLVGLLGRVLDGPMDPVCAEMLAAASSGNPGMLRQLVESSIVSGALTRVRGIWSLVGRLSAPADMASAIRVRLDALDRGHRDAAELVAISGDLDLDVAFDLVADEVLDELELLGLIMVRVVGGAARVRLAHPLFGEILLDELSPLRGRRHRAALADALSARSVTHPADRLQLVRLRLESDGEVDDDHLLESATLAIIEGDTALALRLAGRVSEDGPRARAMHLRGEALYLRGRFDEAGAVLQSIDLDELDDLSAAFVLRRIATWTFFGQWRPTAALDALAAQFERWTGPARAALESYWTMIAAFDGRFSAEALARAAGLDAVTDGIARMEGPAGAAMAHLIRGERRLALERLAQFRQALSEIPPALTWSGPYYASAVEVMTQLELGDPAAARAVLDRDYGPGTPPPFRFVAFAAGRLALAAGDYQQVFDWLDPHIEIGEALGIQTNTAQMQISTALAALATGDHDRAAGEAASLRARIPGEPTLAHFDLRLAILQIEGALGTNPAAGEELVDAAEQAAAVGNRYSEELLLGAAAEMGAAKRAVDRLGELAGRADGEMTPLRHRIALAVLGRDDPDGVLVELERRGLRHQAWRLRRAVR